MLWITKDVTARDPEAARKADELLANMVLRNQEKKIWFLLKASPLT